MLLVICVCVCLFIDFIPKGFTLDTPTTSPWILLIADIHLTLDRAGKDTDPERGKGARGARLPSSSLIYYYL